MAVQWLGLSAFTAVGPGAILGQRTKIPKVMQQDHPTHTHTKCKNEKQNKTSALCWLQHRQTQNDIEKMDLAPHARTIHKLVNCPIFFTVVFFLDTPLQQAGSSLTEDLTCAPCIGSTKS